MNESDKRMTPATIIRIFILLSATLIAACDTNDARTVADEIYSGGPIITADDFQPTVEAVAVLDGKILWAGSASGVAAFRGAETTDIDLAGRTLSPGFIDGHAHVAMFGMQAVGANLLAAPDGQVETIDDLVAELRARLKSASAPIW